MLLAIGNALCMRICAYISLYVHMLVWYAVASALKILIRIESHLSFSTPSSYLTATRSPCLRAPMRDALTTEAHRGPPPSSSTTTKPAIVGGGGVLRKTLSHTESLDKRSMTGNGSSILRMSSSNVSFTSSRGRGGGGGGVPLGDRTNEAKVPWQQRVDARNHTHHADPTANTSRTSHSALMAGAASVRGGVLVVGSGATGRGFVAASPNEEARIAREAGETSRLERLRQVREQVRERRKCSAECVECYVC